MNSWTVLSAPSVHTAGHETEERGTTNLPKNTESEGTLHSRCHLDA